MKPLALVAVAALVGAGCGDLVGFGGDVPPLATVTVTTTGALDDVRVPGATDEDLRVALVWGTQWFPEPLCFLPPASPEVAGAVAAGCRNPLAFTPARVGPSAPLVVGQPAMIDLMALPSADVMVGDVTARVAYASVVVFDDRDHSGTLELGRATRLPSGGFDPEQDVRTEDIVYGASFVAMTEADTRLSFREGAFLESGFYPRHGCGAPPSAFGLLSAGGFTFEAAVAATLAGQLPDQDPTSCREDALDAAIVTVPLRATEEVREVACEQRRLDASVRYRQPPADPPDLTGHALACAHIPSLGMPDPATADLVQLVVAGLADEPCQGLTHYTLIGCDRGELTCDAPQWDFRESPPSWWPCPAVLP
ncbi:MAG: hypothetical protein IPL61_11500 [Myxococcales bacterium]|nr:hypothetical protein [Myxococcales bacterium]